MEIEEGVDNTLRDLHNSSYDTRAEFNYCFINMFTSIDLSMLSSSSIVHVL